MEKAVIRKQIQTILQHLSPEDLQKKSALIAERLFQTGWWNEADLILAFCSMANEVDTHEILSVALGEAKTVGVPRVEGNDLIFHHIRSLANEEEFTGGYCGIKEPAPSLPLLDFSSMGSQKCLIITPGLAFDRKKNRLGRGKGFYDRFLAQVRKYHGLRIFTVGVCFAEQLLEYVPVGDHDHPVDGVITEQEVIY